MMDAWNAQHMIEMKNEKEKLILSQTTFTYAPENEIKRVFIICHI